jgi:CelD/BcsL family acetyltransferase involved in cellulose biosynthesis
MALTIEQVTTVEALDERRREWHALLAACPTPVIFLTPEWITTWWRRFGDDDALLGRKRLCVVFAWDGGRLVGMAPLMIHERRRFGLAVRILAFIGAGFGDYADFLVADDGPAVLRAMWEHLHARGGWDLGVLDDLAPFAKTAALLPSLGLDGAIQFQTSVGNACPYVSTLGSWDDYRTEIFEHRLHGGRRRKNLRRQARQLASRGSVTLRVLRDARDIAGAIDGMAAVGRRAASGTKNLFDEPRYRAFFTEFAGAAAERDWLRIWALELDRRWIAYYFGFQYARRCGLYNTAYDAAFDAYSPGTQLFLRIVEQAFADGLDEVDFMRGDESYKSRWATDVRHNSRVVCRPQRLSARVVGGLYAGAWPRLRALTRAGA